MKNFFGTRVGVVLKNYGLIGAVAGFVLSAGAIGAYGIALALPPSAYEAKVSKSLKQAFESSEWHATAVKQPVIIVMKEKADLSGADLLAKKEDKGAFVYKALTETALRSQAGLLQFLATQGMKKTHSIYIGNMLVLQDATRDLVTEIAAREDVARVLSNAKFKVSLPDRTFRPKFRWKGEGRTAQSNIARTGAARVWSEYGVRGAGIVMAGNDTGVQWDHPALKAHYRGMNSDGTVSHARNWHDAIRAPISDGDNTCGRNLTAPCDDQGHGTHTMGTVLGDDGAENMIGMAPDAQWIACRNMDMGVGRPESYMDCFEFFLAPYAQGGNPLLDGDPALAPHVINNSWGCPSDEGCEGTEMTRILEALMKAGIFVVASAGNDGSGCATITAQPATLSNLVFTVGALNEGADTAAYFSSRGPSALTGAIGPDVSAPGVNIRSSVPGDSYEDGWSGTSMSGPHVAGAVALLWSAKPELIGNFAATSDILHKASKGLTTTENCGGVKGTSIPNNTYGYGALDIYAAVKAAVGH